MGRVRDRSDPRRSLSPPPPPTPHCAVLRCSAPRTRGHPAGQIHGGGGLGPLVEAGEAQVVQVLGPAAGARGVARHARQLRRRLAKGADVTQLRLAPAGSDGGGGGERIGGNLQRPRFVQPANRHPRLKLGSSSCCRSASSIRLRSSSRLASRSRMWSLLTRGQCSGKVPCRQRGGSSRSQVMNCVHVWGGGRVTRQLLAACVGDSGTFQWRLSVQNSQICMPHVQHSLVAGRRHTSQVTTSCTAAAGRWGCGGMRVVVVVVCVCGRGESCEPFVVVHTTVLNQT